MVVSTIPDLHVPVEAPWTADLCVSTTVPIGEICMCLLLKHCELKEWRGWAADPDRAHMGSGCSCWHCHVQTQLLAVPELHIPVVKAL